MRCARLADSLLGAVQPDDGDVELLVAPMIEGRRELIAGAVRDPQFGPTVMLGIGGVLAEAIADVVFRPAPVDAAMAARMIDELRMSALLGPFRGEPTVNRDELVAALVAVGRVINERGDVASVDVNPLIIGVDGRPVAVDALVELRPSAAVPAGPRRRRRPSDEQFKALFEPQGVVVAGASSHPGKFGFVSLHNLLASGYTGAVFGTNLNGDEILGVPTVADITELPDRAVDLAFVCTPPAANPTLLEACARKGVKAAFVTSAGYGEAGPQGQLAEEQLIAIADDLGILLAGPNGPRSRQHAGVAVRADRRSLPSGRTDCRGQPERQLRFQLPQPRQAHRRRYLAPSRPATRQLFRSPTTCRSTPTTRRPA